MLIRSGKQPGLRAGLLGVEGKGLPLTSQRGQHYLLYCPLTFPQALVPRGDGAIVFPGMPLPDLPWKEGRQPVPRTKCVSATLLPHPSQGLPGSSPRQQVVRGSGRDCGGQGGVFLSRQRSPFSC